MANSSYYDLILFEPPETLRKVGVLAGKIAYYNFEWLYAVLLIFNTREALGVQSFMKNYKKSVIMKLGKFRPRHIIHVPQYAVFLETTAELTDFIVWIPKAGYDNTGRYIFVCVNTDPSECDEYEVLETCMKAKIINVVFLKPDSNTTDPVAFTYWPVKPGRCYDPTPVVVDVNWDCPRAACFDNVFPEKLDNMHGCVIAVSTFEQHPYMYLEGEKPNGLDGYILNLLIEALNATLEIVVPPQEHWGHYSNGTWSGSMGDISNDLAHLSLCSAPLTFNKFLAFEISFPYNSVDMVWVTKVPAQKPSWEKLYYPLKIYVRLLTFLMFVFIAITGIALKTNLFKNVFNALNIPPQRLSLLFYSWILFLGMPTSRRPSKLALLGIVYSWIWFAFIMRIIYQAALFGSLKVHAYEDSFETFEEALRSKRPFGGPLTLREYYLEDKFIYDKWVSVNFDDRYPKLEVIANGNSDFVLALNFETILEYLLYHNGTKTAQIIPKKIVASPIVVFFKKFSPLADPVSHVLCSLQEGGFTEKYHSQFMQQGQKIFQKNEEKRNEALRLEHFAGAIAILVLGWVLAVLFFAVEVFCDKWYAHYRNKSE